MGDRLLWHGSAKGYEDWPEPDQDAVKAFVVAHGLDPAEVPTDASMRIQDIDGQPTLRLWVYDRDNGHVVQCPHCEDCAKKREVTIPLATLPPTFMGLDEPRLNELGSIANKVFREMLGDRDERETGEQP